ncbi:DUF1189 family protein [Anaerobacillus sp. CMMVII]|uniref:DUF1189 domain-containing protein n=1 Tax=Anaerobacillus sp. CMMVII TaxID=2755588 RepID=UPI0021B79CCC|nr:DUF1189 domain-containing protein [Anaerobacillus sp. CMMVII]MCT8139718.1 DUF1189 family protein [Anaerobacillus sp. CMMVII]
MNIFQQLVKSIYSPPTVAKFRFQGIGKTILYVFVLMLITTSISGYQLATMISTAANQFQNDLTNEVPDFEIKTVSYYLILMSLFTYSKMTEYLSLIRLELYPRPILKIIMMPL